MIPVSTLVKIAKERLHDAKVLSANGRYDGSIYLCGYVVEVTLKARICKTLKMERLSGIPARVGKVAELKSS